MGRSLGQGNVDEGINEILVRGENYMGRSRLGGNERTGVEREIYTVNRVRDG